MTTTTSLVFCGLLGLTLFGRQCALTDRTEQVVPKTNYVERVVLTHHADGTTTTNIAIIPESVTYETNYVHKEKSGLRNVINAAETGASFLPPPYGTVVSSALGILSAGLTFWVRRKNKQFNESNAMLTTVIRGVEKASRFSEDVKKVKASISNEASYTGVAPKLHALVQDISSRLK